MEGWPQDIDAAPAGRPVIAYGSGGALDTVIPCKSGLHFPELTPESLLTAVQRFDDADFDAATIRHHAARFDKSVFEGKLREYVRNFGI